MTPISVGAALGGVGLVVSCIDQSEPHLLRAAIGRGLAYTDIAPHLMTRRPTEAMRAEAARTGARIVLGSGLAPGISSLLARLGAERVGAIEKVEVDVLLSVGNAYGPASRAYLMEEMAMQWPNLFYAAAPHRSRIAYSAPVPRSADYLSPPGPADRFFPHPA